MAYLMELRTHKAFPTSVHRISNHVNLYCTCCHRDDFGVPNTTMLLFAKEA